MVPRPWFVPVLALGICSCIGLPPDPPGRADGGGSTTTAPATNSTGENSLTSGPACEVDAECTDDLFCNGEETCDPAAGAADIQGCVAGSPPCQEQGLLCDEQIAACIDTCEDSADADGDRFDSVDCGGLDCDDTNSEIGPEQQEVCDPLGVDEDCDPSTVGMVDADGDGLVSSECCNLDNCGADCDDTVQGPGSGNWSHCSACGDECGVQHACDRGTCIPARRVFITSTAYNGNMGGLAGADSICQQSADEAGLEGIFKAYMVDESQGLDRLEQPAVPFVRLDGVRIANDWDDLSDESILAPLDLDEFGQPTEGNAWTGLTNVGKGELNKNCDSWTSSESGCLKGLSCGGAGESNLTDEHWDGYFVFHCDTLFRLYCIEQ